MAKINQNSILLEVIQNDPSIQLGKFDWTITVFEEEKMLIKVDFENPLKVSSSTSGRDILLITILKPEFFRTESDDVPMLENFKTDGKIPPQFANDKATKVYV